MSIATKLQTIYDGVEDVRDALQEKDATLGRGVIGTLGDDVRTLLLNKGYGVTVYGDVRTEEEVDGETEYTYTNSILLDSTLVAGDDYMTTDIIDGLGELDGDIVTLQDGRIQIPLNTGTKITVDPTKVYVKFRDPIVENIILTNWGTNGKITLAQVRAITSLGTHFNNTAIVTFNEFKWFDGISMTSPTGSSSMQNIFVGCASLTEVKLPRVTDLGDRLFKNCSSLTHVELPDTLLYLGRGNCYGDGYFQNTLIEELIIPDSVVAGQRSVFNGMPNLKRLVWGKNLPFPTSNYGGDYPCANCPNLEKIENFPPTLNPNNSNLGDIFKNSPKVDFSNIIQTVILTPGIVNGTQPFAGTKVFDYAPNATLSFQYITTNNGGGTPLNYDYCFNSSSEIGAVLDISNWTYYPMVNRATGISKVIFGNNVTDMGKFGNSSYVSEWILPCTTPPTLTADNPVTWECGRVFVPAASLATYQTADHWSTITNRLRAYRDPTNASATFCSIPAAAPVPSDYTKVAYISNIDGTGIKNCQISNIGYIPKQYSQILLDWSHEVLPGTTSGGYANILSTGDNATTFVLRFGSSGYEDRNPVIRRDAKANAVSPMGLSLGQEWTYNSHITGESFGQRSTLKFNFHWTEYHGLVHQVDEHTGDAVNNFMLLRYNNNNYQNRKIKIYRLCFFEPVSGFNDVDDPSQYEIVRDYIPVMRNSDSKFGLYERLTDTFYPSTIAAAPFSGPAYE